MAGSREIDCMELVLQGPEDQEGGDYRVVPEDALGEGAGAPDVVGVGWETFVQ